MRINFKIILLVISIILLTSFQQKDEPYIWFSRGFGISQTCDGDEVELLIEVKTGSVKKISVHSFSLDNYDFKIFKDDKEIKGTDTLVLTKNNPIILKVYYKIFSFGKPAKLTFKTNLEKYINNEIKLNYGQYLITTQDIRGGKEQFINITESCQDSIKVVFPFGGTISSVTLFNATTKESQWISYHLGGSENFIYFSKTEIGRYHVDFGSCHWGGEFWMTIK